MAQPWYRRWFGGASEPSRDPRLAYVRLLNERGKAVTELSMPLDARKPQVQYGADVYVASHQQDGIWIYRRVGTERPA